MTAASFGVLSYGATIGWLAILFFVPSTCSYWRTLAFLVALCVAGILLSWWHCGLPGAALAAFGVSGGAFGATSIRLNKVVRD
jgi:hypothetical protein